MPVKKQTEFTEAQKILARVYGGGDYAHILEDGFLVADAFARDLEATGDGLFTFLWRELAEDGDTDLEGFASRAAIAAKDCQAVADAIQAEIRGPKSYQEVTYSHPELRAEVYGATGFGWYATKEDAAKAFPRTPTREGKNALFVYLVGMTTQKLTARGFVR